MIKLLLNAGIIASVTMLWSCGSDESEDLDCNSSNLAVSIVNTTNPGCNASDGIITVSGTGGSGIYSYSIDGVNFSAQGSFQNLGAGAYTLSVRDNNQCIATVATTLSNESNLSLTASVDEAGCGTSNGSVTITATGGEAPYTYQLNTGGFQSSNQFTNLTSGSYLVVVRDNSGCETSNNINILSGISLASNIKSIIDANCAVAGCHVGSGLPDFRNSATIIANAANIRTNTQNKTMPPAESGRTLTDAQIMQIACWVNDGALNN